MTVAFIVVIEFYPMFWLFVNSFKSQTEFLSEPAWTLPTVWHFENYATAWSTGNIGGNLFNSVLATFPALLLVLLLGSAAAYALEVMVWRGRTPTLLLFVSGIMIPGQMIIVPLFIAYFRLHLTDTLLPLTITYVALGLPLTVFMMAAYLRAVPRELFEAATIDGATML
ncbi:MAG: carbohydrate ABC transporter permease, partial [Propionibacteriaceae bacterium]|nr:carbohydrate ABC transporter permease [Propionibacteriaceae bacterium]